MTSSTTRDHESHFDYQKQNLETGVTPSDNLIETTHNDTLSQQDLIASRISTTPYYYINSPNPVPMTVAPPWVIEKNTKE